MSTPLYETSNASPVAAFAGRWQQGERTNAREFILQHPELGQRKSLVLDLAFEEFCLRREAGETVVPSTFCEQFPGYRRSLRRLFAVRGYVDEHPSFVAAAEQGDTCHLPEPGEQFLAFDLVEELGTGAFARVYLARQPELGGRLVALKVARHGASEARTLGRLRHPNIVPVHSIDTDPVTGLTAVCMAYLGRSTLCDLLDAAFVKTEAPQSAAVVLRMAEDADAPPAPADLSRRMSSDDSYVLAVARIVQQLAEALDHTHRAGLVHRDLKPSNVLLAPGGVPMLLDFNLSIDVHTLDAGVGGTLPYMPPELLRWLLKEHRDPLGLNDPRTDIFSLGVIFYELLTGVVPFGDPEPGPAAQGAAELLARQAKGVPSAACRNRQVDPAIERIMARCLALNPADRYASADELAADLSTYLYPVQARAGHLRQNWQAFSTVAAAGLLLAVGVGGWYATPHWRQSGAAEPSTGNSAPNTAVVGKSNSESLKATVPSEPTLSDLEQGLRDFEQGQKRDDPMQMEAAIAAFDRHLERHAADADALFARGQAHRKLGHLDNAQLDYQLAAKNLEGGFAPACLACCLAQQSHHREAAHWYGKAIDAGYATAAVHNNLGFSQFRSNLIEQAKQNFDRAVALNGELCEARHNRAIVGLRMALISSAPPTAEALADIDFAVERGKETTQLFSDAAWLYALAAKTQPELRPRCLSLLARGIEKGMSRKRIEDNEAFAGLSSEPEISQLMTPSSEAVATTSSELVVPLPFSLLKK